MSGKQRKKSNCPPRLRARPRGSKVWYYYDAGGKPRKEIPLGNDYALALKKWAEFEIDAQPRHPSVITFRYVAERYTREIVPKKSANTQSCNLSELKMLYQFFDNPPAPLEEIKPVNIRQYIDWRLSMGVTARVNREKSLFSHIWNMARDWGYTDLQNPCTGIRGHKESGRKDIYIEDDLYNLVRNAASQELRDFMDLIYITGQRPSDVLKMTENHIQDNCISITQSKTGAKLRISIEGELLKLLSNIKKNKSKQKIHNLFLVVNKSGQKLTLNTLQKQLRIIKDRLGVDKDAFQLRDLRAKAATDKTELSGDIRQAQKQLGHSSNVMTERYVRGRRGDKVTPTK